MKFWRIIGYYLIWHYGPAFLDIWRIYKNFIWFLYHFFSIPLLLKTLFSPLERLHERYNRNLDISDFFSTLALNSIMRVVGAILRLFVILAGIASISLFTLAGVFFLIFWIFFPAIIPILFFWGIYLFTL